MYITWIPCSQVVDQEVVQFSSVFYTSGTTADNDHVQQTINFLRGLSRESSSFNAIHQLCSDLLGIPNFLQEATVLLNTLDTKSLVGSTHTDDQVIIGNGTFSLRALDFRIIYIWRLDVNHSRGCMEKRVCYLYLQW